MTCFACHGPYHPATGHMFMPPPRLKEQDGDPRSDPVIAYCGPCARRFFAWWRGHSKRKWGGMNFYEEAAKKPTEQETP